MEMFDPAQLRAARQARVHACAHYLFNPRVTLIDVGFRILEHRGTMTDELTVRVHVRDKPRGAQLEDLGARRPELMIDKARIPFAVDIVEGAYALQWHLSAPPPRAGTFARLRGGISISNERDYTYATLGGIVLDRASRTPMILSNWHVLAGSAWARPGLRILQPGSADSGGVQQTVARLTRHAMDEGIDAAVATLDGARPWTNDQYGIGAVAGIATPALGMRLTKSGRGSGQTHGMIDGVDGEYSIRYGGLLRRIRHVCRIVPVTPGAEASRGGDSGSWWLDPGSLRAAALHFAGADDPESALAMAMPPVLDALGVDVALGAATEAEGRRAA